MPSTSKAPAQRTLEFAFVPQWEWVRRIRQEVANLFANDTRDFVPPAIKTASELVENAVKYALFDTAKKCSFALCLDRESITIVVSHGIAPEYPYATLARHIERIAAAPNKDALYQARLLELAHASGDGSQLGLLWIAAEGRFELQCKDAGGLIAVTAKRRIS